MKRQYFRPSRCVSGPATFVLSLLSTPLWMFSLSAPAADVFVFRSSSIEISPVLRFEVARNGDLNLVQSVDFSTHDGTALAGVHYAATTGTVIFAPGQHVATVDVPLIDHGLVDGERSFHLVLSNASPGLEVCQAPSCGGSPPVFPYFHDGVGEISDNELPPTLLDPSFVPDARNFSFVMPDGRILSGPTMLQSNGWVDAGFVPGGADAQAQFNPLHVYDDGRILGWWNVSAGVESRLVRLFSTGGIEQILDTDIPMQSQFAGVQTDGKMVMSIPVWSAGPVYNQLVRLNQDGTRDTNFNEVAFIPYGRSPVKVQGDGHILVIQLVDPGDGTLVSRITRLNPDGAIESTFPIDGEIVEIFVRRSGKIVVRRRGVAPLTDWQIVQLNPDGTLDPAFRFDLSTGHTSLETWAEGLDGRVVLQNESGLRRLNVDGSLDLTFSPTIHRPIYFEGGHFDPNPGIAITPTGHVLFSGELYAVDGLPVQDITLHPDGFLRRFIRLRDGSPQPEFRAFEPARCSRSADAVLVHVVRTGDTSTAASVDFSTGDDSARAGVDYLPQSGTLNFAPLEVGREIRVPLLARRGVMERQRFYLRLTNPSPGYGTTPIPVVIWPELRLSTEQLLSGNRIMLKGTVPGLRYALDSSPVLDWPWNWTRNPARKATSHTMEFDVGPPNAGMQFYRGRRE